MGRHRAAALGDLRGARVKSRIPGTPLVRVMVVLAAAAGVVALLWWRGPNWGEVWHAFDAVRWYWVAAAIGLNLLSVMVRAVAWRTVIKQAMKPPHPSYMLVFSAFSVGLFANAVLPGRIGELARVAVLTRKLRLQGQGERGTWAALVGTVFAHRLFDLVPTAGLILYVLFTARIPHWAITSLIAVLAIGFALFAFAFASARNRRQLEELGPIRRLVEMGRHGLGVLHAPGAAAVAALFQCLGWLCQFLAVYTAMRAFDIHSPLPAAGLVLLLMNVATLFPALARQHRPAAGGDCAAAALVRRPGREGDRVRLRAPGDRGVGGHRRRPDLPRARGALVRDAAPHAAGGRGGGARGSGWSHRGPGRQGPPCARSRPPLASRASSRRGRPPPLWPAASGAWAPRPRSCHWPTGERGPPRSSARRSCRSSRYTMLLGGRERHRFVSSQTAPSSLRAPRWFPSTRSGWTSGLPRAVGSASCCRG